jgi:hypothetical protein
VFNGTRYHELSTFLAALEATGHEITAVVRHNIANFAGLQARGENGALYPVAAAAFARTEIVDDHGNEAVVPMSHSELAFSVKPEHVNDGLRIRADAQYYQGIARIGFYGAGCRAKERWTGDKVSDRFSPPEAIQALELVGLFTSVIRTAAQRRGLAIHGYGVLGVCNDSVAIVQQIVRGRINSYPLFMLDDLVLVEIDERIAQSANNPAAASHLEQYRALKASVATVPSDADENPTIRERALISIPWQPGAEVYYSTMTARSILSGQ